MKLLDVTLTHYAHFDTVSLDLSGGRGGLHLVYGANEAGKSAMLRAVRGLLFGVELRSADTFRYGAQSLRIGATLQGPDGATIRVVRRKGQKNTLVDDAGTSLGESVLAALLGGLPRERFDQLFGLTHAELLRGSEALLKSRGEAGEALFAAAMGGARLREVLTSLEARADGLFRPRASTAQLNQLIDRYRGARERIEQSGVRGEAVAALEQECQRVQRAIVELQDRRAACERERTRLERLARAIPHLPERQARLAELAGLADVPDLPADFSARWQTAQGGLRRAVRAVAEADQIIARLRATLERLEVPDPLLAEAQAVRLLFADLSIYRQAAHDLPVQRAELDLHRTVAEHLLAELAPGRGLDESERLRLTVAQRARIRELGESLHTRSAAWLQAQREVERLNRERGETDIQLAKAPPELDTGPLRLALQLAREEIPSDKDVERFRSDGAMLADKVAGDLQRLGLWNGPAEQLECLAVPGDETVDRFAVDLEQFDRDLAEGAKRIAEMQEELGRGEARIRAEQHAGAVPSEADLLAARTAREVRWATIRDAGLQAITPRPVDAEPAAEYEALVAIADSIADRLRREVARVTQLAQLVSERERLEGRLLAEQEQHQARGCGREATQAAWAAAWAPCGIAPLPPREMRAWLQRYRRVLATREEQRQISARVALLDGQVADHRTRLSAALGAIGAPAVAPDEALRVLYARTEAALTAAERTRVTRDRLRQASQELQQKWADAGAAEQTAGSEIERLRTQWAAAVAPLGLGADATPPQAAAVLERITQLFEGLKLVREKRTRVEQMQATVAQYQTRAEAMFGRVAPDLVGRPLDEAVGVLEARRDVGEKAAVSERELRSQLEEHEQAREVNAREVGELEAEVTRHRVHAGGTTDAEVEQIAQRADAKHACRERLDRAETAVREHAGGGTVEDLIAEASALDADTLPGQIAECSREVTELDSTLHEQLKTEGAVRQQLAAIDGSAAAAEAAQEAQGILGQICRETRLYVRARLAADLLREEIERYRQQHHGPLLARAGELFRRLTCEAFSGLGQQFDDKDQPVLAAIRASGAGETEEVRVEGLSDGTRDQLYLALRLAYLLRYLETSPPLPLILDDILINFDDERARATLAVLGEVSRQGQVLLFTHHRHLLDLAQSVVPAEWLFTHVLGT